MSVKKIIAIVGAASEEGRLFAKRIVGERYRFLLVSDDVIPIRQISEDIREKNKEVEIETVNCLKDGCWEADIILLIISPGEECRIAELIKQVTTQKIVVSISEKEGTLERFQELMPNSKLLGIKVGTGENDLILQGGDEESRKEVIDIFSQSGYAITYLQQKK